MGSGQSADEAGDKDRLVLYRVDLDTGRFRGFLKLSHRPEP